MPSLDVTIEGEPREERVHREMSKKENVFAVAVDAWAEVSASFVALVAAEIFLYGFVVLP